MGVTVKFNDVSVVEGCAGKGYGTLSSECLDAINLVAQNEGVILDPVCTGKAMAGLINTVKNDQFRKEESIVLINTGGTPGTVSIQRMTCLTDIFALSP